MVKHLTAHKLLEGLRRIGVIDVDMRESSGKIEDRLYRVNHDLMWQYARQCASFLNQQKKLCKTKKIHSCLPSLQFLGFNNCTQLEDQKDPIKVEWNALLVDQYQAIVDKQENGKNNRITKVVFSMLPSHLMNAFQLNRVSSFLVNEKFIIKRLSTLGVEKATERHIADVENLHRIIPEKNGDPDVEVTNSTKVFSATYCFNFIAELLWKAYKHEVTIDQLGDGAYQALIQVGIALQKHSSWVDAIDCFLKALEICRNAGFEDDHVIIVQILKLIECSSLKTIVLVPIDSPDRLIFKNAHILSGQNGAKALLELSSHPGYSISPNSDKFSGGFAKKPYLELGFGPNENAVLASYDGTFITRVDDNAVFNVSHGFIKEGASLVLKPGPKKSIRAEKARYSDKWSALFSYK